MKTSVTRFRQIVLFAGDFICLVLGLFAALLLRYGFPVSSETFEIHKIPFAIIFVFWLISFFIGGLYSLRNAKNSRQFFTLFLSIFLVDAVVSILFFYFIPYFSITPKIVLFLVLGISCSFLSIWRFLFNRFVSLPPQKIAILGRGPEVDELIRDLEKHPQQGYKVILHLNGQKEENMKNLPGLFRSMEIDAVVVAIDYKNSPELQKSLFECIPLHIRFFDFVDFYEQNMQKIPLAVIDRAWFLENINEPGKQFFSGLKRACDILISIILGILGVVLTPFIAIAVLLEMGRPIFFSQTRVGEFGRQFRILKFRSLKRENDDSSISAVGHFLRSSHLDEIPQLWNILRGEMSFVGPRPERPHFVEQLKLQIPFYAERLLIRPGITGWAQLHEPRAKVSDALTKLQYDLFYIKHRSILLDLEIILKTLRILIKLNK